MDPTATPRATGPRQGQPGEADGERLAYRLLALREHSRAELRRKLGARGIEGAALDGLLDRLALTGALDEARLVERYVAERAGKGFGPLRIRAELREKGVSDELIDPHLDAMREDWSQQLAALYARRYRGAPPQGRDTPARRVRFLAQRGYPSELIRRFLRGCD